ncbi:MAG: AbrB/MazE/SpoVT family DNA-binding domain-containing protein, partial [Terrimicrobiaceae bacterium]
FFFVQQPAGGKKLTEGSKSGRKSGHASSILNAMTRGIQKKSVNRKAKRPKFWKPKGYQKSACIPYILRYILRPMNTTLQRWGNSHGVRIPKAIVESLGMEIGSEVLIELSGDRSKITITPARDERPVRARHRIEDLVASSPPDAFAVEYPWGEPHGTEEW